MEQPNLDDPDYQEYLKYMASRDDRVVEVEIAYLGVVGVDSGQLLVTDPCYIDSEWLDEPYQDDRVYKDTQTGATVKWGQDFVRFTEPLEPYGKSPDDLIEAGRLVQVPPPPKPESFNYSYNGACQATLSEGYGELVYSKGHTGAGVVFQSGWGDGFYPVYGESTTAGSCASTSTSGLSPHPSHLIWSDLQPIGRVRCRSDLRLAAADAPSEPPRRAG